MCDQEEGNSDAALHGFELGAHLLAQFGVKRCQRFI
jgi:hypothetical protein